MFRIRGFRGMQGLRGVVGSPCGVWGVQQFEVGSSGLAAALGFRVEGLGFRV